MAELHTYKTHALFPNILGFVPGVCCQHTRVHKYTNTYLQPHWHRPSNANKRTRKLHMRRSSTLRTSHVLCRLQKELVLFRRLLSRYKPQYINILVTGWLEHHLNDFRDVRALANPIVRASGPPTAIVFSNLLAHPLI